MRKFRLPAYWNRNFNLYFFGSLASALGGTLSSFCTGLFFLDMTGSAALMSAYIAWTTALSLILTPFMGAVCDRLNKVKVMWVCDYIFSATDLIVAALLFCGLTGPAATAAVFINGTINCLVGTLFSPASESMIPMLVEKKYLTQVYSVFTTRGSFISLFGVVFAAALYSMIGYQWILLINGLCVGFSGVIEMFIRAEQPLSQFKANRVWQDWKEGLRYMLKMRVLVLIGCIAVPINFLLTGLFSIGLPYMINTDLQLAPMVLAVCEGAFSVGGILMALLLSSRSKVQAHKAVPAAISMMTAMIISMAAAYIAFHFTLISAPVFIAIIVLLCALLSASATLANIPLNSVRAALIEPEYMGRVQSLFGTLCNAASPVAAVVYGLIIDGIGMTAVFTLSTVGMVLCLMLLLSQKKHFGDL